VPTAGPRRCELIRQREINRSSLERKNFNVGDVFVLSSHKIDGGRIVARQWAAGHRPWQKILGIG
jgi:hypothetical protein